MRRLVVVALVGLAVLASACGSAHRSALLIVGSSALKTSQGHSARITTSADLPSATPGGARQVTTGSGVVDFDHGGGKFTLDASSFGIGAGNLELDVVGDAFYIKGFGSAIPISTPWIKLDLKALEKASGAGSLNVFNPSANLEQIVGVTGPVKVVGKEKIRGTETTHFSFTVDLDKAAKLVKPADRAAIEAAAAAVQGHTVPIDLWADSQGRARKFSQRVTLASGTLTGTATLTQEFYDFGVKVDVTAPPANQVTDVSSFLGG